MIPKWAFAISLSIKWVKLPAFSSYGHGKTEQPSSTRRGVATIPERGTKGRRVGVLRDFPHERVPSALDLV